MDNQTEQLRPVGRPFAVADNVYCCWDFDHRGRTLEYLEGIDPDYFSTIATLLAQQLDSGNAVASSVALRVLYHQGVETLMSLLGAAIQGSMVVPAWIAKCSSGDLKYVAARLRSGRSLLTEAGPRRLTFDGAARHLHRFAWADEAEPDSTAVCFGRFWHRLAGELLDDTARAEYNALKHGSRIRPGGFTTSIGIQEAPGTPAPAEKMQLIGGSNFGSTFFVSETIGTAKWHVRTRRTSVNWLPEPLAQRLVLISMSLSNIVGALRCELGVDPTTVRFVRPTPPESFDDVWKQSSGLTSTNMDYAIAIETIDEVPRDELQRLLESESENGR